ncbi:MAG: hypothetical protein QOH90_652, partial [Actinomycetota bacterium]|nr:hypothetical protein [Actinomycetota bacterium]
PVPKGVGVAGRVFEGNQHQEVVVSVDDDRRLM